MNDPSAPFSDSAAVSQPPPPPAAPAPRALSLRFTGSGGEYFRIWIVNLLLTLLTLGIYSAWAKVRKTRYLWSNTLLDGVALRYHASPGAILRGRIVVGAVFVAYSIVGRISYPAGLAALTVIGLAAPWFFRKAVRFKLSNTSWRGVRFGFAATTGGAYAVFLPAVILWLALMAASPRPQPGEKPTFPILFFVVYGLFLVLVPYFHARIVRFQRGSTTYGRQPFEFRPSVGAFYALYGKTFGLFLAGVAVLGAAVAVLVATGALATGSAGKPDPRLIAAPAFAAVFLVYLPSGAFFLARLQRLLWSRTTGGLLRFASDMGALRYAWLLLKNGFLTVVTVGLYWPWAAIDLARYQIECIGVEASGPIDAIVASDGPVEASATGDGAADFLGWDLGW